MHRTIVRKVFFSVVVLSLGLLSVYALVINRDSSFFDVIMPRHETILDLQIVLIINGEETSSTKNYGETYIAEAPHIEGMRFLFWQDVIKNHKILTYQPTYTFSVTSLEHRLEAVYASLDEHRVIIKDINQDVLSILTPTMNADQTFSVSAAGLEAPAKPGYYFAGFNQELDALVFPQGKKDLEVILQYEKTYNQMVNVIVDHVTHEVLFDEPLFITTPSNKNGLFFSHWESNGVLFSYHRELFLTVLEDQILTPIYSETHITSEPLVYLNSNIYRHANENHVQVTLSARLETQGYTLIETGVMFSDELLGAHEFNLDNNNIAFITSTFQNGFGEFAVAKTNFHENTLWQARPYLVFYDEITHTYDVVYGNTITFLTTETQTESLFELGAPLFEDRNSSWLVSFEDTIRWQSDYTNRTINGQSFEPLKFFAESFSDLDVEAKFMEFYIGNRDYDYLEGYVGISDYNSNTSWPLDFYIYDTTHPDREHWTILFYAKLERYQDAHHYLLNLNGVERVRYEYSSESVSPNGYANRIVLVEPVFHRLMDVSYLKLKYELEKEIAQLVTALSEDSYPRYTLLNKELSKLRLHGASAQSLGNTELLTVIDNYFRPFRESYHKVDLGYIDENAIEHNTSWLVDFTNEERWSSDYGNRTINGQSFDYLTYYSTSHPNLDTNPRYMQFDLTDYDFDFVEGYVGASDEIFSTSEHPAMFNIYLDNDLVQSFDLIYGNDPLHYLINLNNAALIRFEISAAATDLSGYANRPVIVKPVFWAEDKPPMTVTTSLLRVGTIDETPLYTIETHIPGPTVFIVGGIHGSERAGWHTPMNLLGYHFDELTETWVHNPNSVYEFQKGTIHILPRAYIRATDANHRFVLGEEDLNRLFPGNPNGTDLEKLAYEILQAMLLANADFAFDLHEARYSRAETDAPDGALLLGDRIIANVAEDFWLLNDAITSFNTTFEPDVTFLRSVSYSDGFINIEYTNATGKTIITIETTRGGGGNTDIESETIPISYRIAQQKAFVDTFLKAIWNEYPVYD